MKRVLIAANSKLLTEVLSEYLSDSFDVAVCHTGLEAVRIMREFEPDVLALDLMISGIGGIGVLQEAQSLGVLPRVVAFSTYIPEYSAAMLEQMKIDALIRMPSTPEFLADQIRSVIVWQAEESPLEVRLHNLLTRLGFCAGGSNYSAVVTCLTLYLQDPAQSLVYQLYPMAAAVLGRTWTQVDRAVGRAVEAAWKCRDSQIWKQYFPTDQNGQVKRPANAQFFAVIAGHLLPWKENEKNTATG